MKHLILVRGTPGSGKSTFVKANLTYQLEMEGYVHLEADMYFEDVDGHYDFDGSRIKNAHEWCKKTAMEMMKQSKGVIVSNTFTQKWEMESYLELAEKLGYQVTIFRMTSDYGSIHDVPAESIEKMKARFEDIEGEILK